MRLIIATSAILALAACNVSKDNNGVTVQYDQNTADNAAADVGNTAQNIAGDIGNDVSKTANKVQDKVAEHKDHDDAGNASENKAK